MLGGLDLAPPGFIRFLMMFAVTAVVLPGQQVIYQQARKQCELANCRSGRQVSDQRACFEHSES